MVASGQLDFSMRDLARRLGVSHQAPYHHFAGREELLGAIREDGFQEFLSDLRRAREASPNPRTALHRLGYAYLEFAQRRPHHYRLMFSVPASDGTTTHTPDSAVQKPSAAADSFEELHGCIRDLQSVGQYPGRSSLDVAVAVWAWSHGLALLLSQGQLRWLDYGDRLTPELFDRWAALLPTAGSTANPEHTELPRPKGRSKRRLAGSPPRLRALSRGPSSPNG
jgi:AcrR family transcriptional regulator